METTKKLDIEKTSVRDFKSLVESGMTIDQILSQYKEYVFEKHKEEGSALKWACLAGTFEGIITVMIKNSIEDDRRI